MNHQTLENTFPKGEQTDASQHTISGDFRDGLDPSNIDPNGVEIEVARQLSGMSVVERDEVYLDLHGITRETPETAESVDKAQTEFQKQLYRLVLDENTDTSAYERAKIQDSSYVNCTNFRLRFLRADLFDIKRSAARFINHFNFKLELFGEVLLTKTLRQEHLDSGSRNALYSGYSQQLPTRDHAGRIIVVNYLQPPDVTLLDKCRHEFYVGMVQSEDEEIQKKGVVGVSIFGWQPKRAKTLKDDFWKAAQTINAVPVRVVSLHICHDSRPMWSPIVALLKVLLGSFIRVRIREHCQKTDDQDQCILSVRSHGIPIAQEHFPCLDHEQSHIDTSHHVAFWERRRDHALTLEKPVSKPEVAMPTSVDSGDKVPKDSHARVITTPAQNDVLLGRGKRFYEHSGNIRFRYWIDNRVQEYNATRDVAKKKKLTADVVNLVKKSGGQFLRNDDHLGWFVADDETARRKVSHVFRNMRSHRTASSFSQCPTSRKKRRRTEEV